MGKITRNPEIAAREKYDLIVIGGGIYGSMLALEASRRDLSVLLLERDDFGAHTSFHSLRIIHGGLRYLQSLDLPRFQESVAERHWFLKHFPDFVRPLSCLMPLYGKGMRKPPILQAALMMNDFLSRNRNQAVLPESRLPDGSVISSAQTRQCFPGVDMNGLKGGAVWHDACMPDSQCLLIEIIRTACGFGACALNYMAAAELLKTGNRISGVRALDRETGNYYDFRVDTVVNAAGPWTREVAAAFHRDNAELFRPSLAFNLLFDREALSSHALAVAPKKPGARTYFIVPWKGKIFAGTGHYPWLRGTGEKPAPSDAQLSEVINDLNLAIPGLSLKPHEIAHIFAGLLPAAEAGTEKLAVREMILDHSADGGPQGLWSVSGVKFTTSRRVAEKTLNRIFPQKTVIRPLERTSFKSGCENFRPELSPDDIGQLQELAAETAALHPDDLIYRRTTLWENPRYAEKVKERIFNLLKN